MMNRKKTLDFLGILIEDYLVKVVMIAVLVIFLANYTFIRTTSYGFPSIEEILVGIYNVHIKDNIGSFTTVAAVFFGAFFTVLTVFGSLKSTSIIATLAQANLRKLILLLTSTLISASLLLIYSLFYKVLDAGPIQSFIFIYLILYMFFTAFRFAVIIIAMYIKDLGKLKHDIEQEKSSNEKTQLVLERLNSFVAELEQEKYRRDAESISEYLERKKE